MWKDGFIPRSAYCVGSPVRGFVMSAYDVFILHALLFSYWRSREKSSSRCTFGTQISTTHMLFDSVGRPWTGQLSTSYREFVPLRRPICRRCSYPSSLLRPSD